LNNQVRQENDRRKREEDRLKFTLWKKMDGEGPGLFQTARKKTILERRWHLPQERSFPTITDPLRKFSESQQFSELIPEWSLDNKKRQGLTTMPFFAQCMLS
jgi:hypothetical protein